MKKVFEVKEKCQACKGTGVYVGMAERDGAGVICSKCKGTGCFHFKHEYEKFADREVRDDIRRVYKTNPGIVVGEGGGRYRLEDFGGIPYEAFLAGQEFPVGSEDRSHVCPKWWTQNCGEVGPRWGACDNAWGKHFSDCKYFPVKHQCWEKWDKESCDAPDIPPGQEWAENI